ncbi:YsnF/AvaK domain-containing protein [Rathayibacter sp. VKM Ac-2835]|uniref:YsnF/AvaK domain-containing protein n=1 Tax=Rathayibacter sp. VKM Ac-2835 TaxID=2739043 RepID=UPI001567B101|nr:YsnF/AvaK domain-containing protein [Rathayibacter sp. VKM Ac-2835]NRG42272.1 YsnF/AvaK domain-containing protein [Rathayibacter sp. VKM Ac-2835]
MSATPSEPTASEPGPAPTAEVVLHEERLLVGTRRHATERVRVRRVVVTEQRTITVDVRREELRVTREPILDGPPLPDAITAAPQESIVVVLHEERIDVVRTVVPVERVTLRVESVSGARDVTASLRHEAVEVASSTAQEQEGPDLF